MSDLLERTIPTSFLEELLEHSVPCGGVKALKIPPCGAEAVVRLDRRSREHCRDCPVEPSDFKCQECYEKWRTPLELSLALGGLLRCRPCGYVARTIDEFARYVAL